MSENSVWEVDNELETHLKDIEALGDLVMAAAHDHTESLTPDSF